MPRLPATYEFGDFRVDASSELVSRAGAPVLLEPKAFELLVYFIQHRGQLLDKQEILDAVWGKTFVSENSLTRVVAQLRKVLGDDAHESKYIETVPRRGYRFVADVRSVVEAEPAPPRGKGVPVLVGVALVILLGVGSVLLFHGSGGEEVSWSRQPVQLTSSAALDISLSMSPDGNAFAFSSSKNGGVYNIWVANMGENEEERQLTFEDELVGWPQWSPDGTFIALQVKGGGDTHVGVVPAGGGTMVQLTNEPGQNWVGTWSPDGDKIAFASWRGDAWNLRWVSRTDKSECQITDYTAQNSFVRYPAWSPLGDQIVYEYAETTGDIWMLERP